VAILFKKFAKVYIYETWSFKSSEGYSCVKCNVETNTGYLFPLHIGMIFINKPVIYVSIKDIKCIEFYRVTYSLIITRYPMSPKFLK